MNANLFSRLFDGSDDPNRSAIETIDGSPHRWPRIDLARRQMGMCWLVAASKAGDRPLSAAHTEIGAGPRACISRDGRAGAVICRQHRLTRDTNLSYFIFRTRALAGGLRPVEGGKASA